MSGGEGTATAATVSAADSPEKIQTAIKSLSSIVPSLSNTTTTTLFFSPEIYSHISALLRKPNSGAGDNNLCRWLYDTFQSSVKELQLLVLRFLPVIAGVYLSRLADRKPQAGFEAFLLALYAHETTSRAGEAVTVTIPDPSQPNPYQQSQQQQESSKAQNPNNKNNSTSNNSEPVIAVVSPSLEPHGTVRSTRRARIVGVALELFFKRISHMPVSSKIDFCEFCKVWAGQDGTMYEKFEEVEGVGVVDAEVELEEKEKEKGKVEGRVPLPWELLQPVLRILGHCLLGPNNKDLDLFNAATEACRCLFARSMHDVNAQAILPVRSLLRLSKSVMANNQIDPTELSFTDVISL